MQSPLNDALAARRRSRMNAEQQAAYEEFLRHLDAGQAAEQALKPGDPMPAFLLPSAEGKLVHSDALLESGPLVVSFFRGDWCPYCAATLDALEAALPDLKDAGGTLVAITPETGGRALAMKRDHKLHYEVLTDVDMGIAMVFGIVFRTPPLYAGLLRRGGVDLARRSGNPTWFLPIPATFLVRSDGIIARAWVNSDFTQRAEPLEILAALKSL
jgi:peroxiredoxin